VRGLVDDDCLETCVARLALVQAGCEDNQSGILDARGRRAGRGDVQLAIRVRSELGLERRHGRGRDVERGLRIDLAARQIVARIRHAVHGRGCGIVLAAEGRGEVAHGTAAEPPDDRIVGLASFQFDAGRSHLDARVRLQPHIIQAGVVIDDIALRRGPLDLPAAVPCVKYRDGRIEMGQRQHALLEGQLIIVADAFFRHGHLKIKDHVNRRAGFEGVGQWDACHKFALPPVCLDHLSVYPCLSQLHHRGPEVRVQVKVDLIKRRRLWIGVVDIRAAFELGQLRRHDDIQPVARQPGQVHLARHFRSQRSSVDGRVFDFRRRLGGCHGRDGGRSRGGCRHSGRRRRSLRQ